MCPFDTIVSPSINFICDVSTCMNLGTFLDISTTVNACRWAIQCTMIKLGTWIFIIISIPISVSTFIGDAPLMAKLIDLLMLRHQSFSGCFIWPYTHLPLPFGTFNINYHQYYKSKIASNHWRCTIDGYADQFVNVDASII